MDLSTQRRNHFVHLLVVNGLHILLTAIVGTDRARIGRIRRASILFAFQGTLVLRIGARSTFAFAAGIFRPGLTLTVHGPGAPRFVLLVFVG